MCNSTSHQFSHRFIRLSLPTHPAGHSYFIGPCQSIIRLTNRFTSSLTVLSTRSPPPFPNPRFFHPVSTSTHPPTHVSHHQQQQQQQQLTPVSKAPEEISLPPPLPSVETRSIIRSLAPSLTTSHSTLRFYGTTLKQKPIQILFRPHSPFINNNTSPLPCYSPTNVTPLRRICKSLQLTISSTTSPHLPRLVQPMAVAAAAGV